MKKLIAFIKGEEGVTAIEYSLIAGLIAVLIIVAVTNVGSEVNRVFNAVYTALSGVPG